MNLLRTYQICVVFAAASLLSFGGGNAIIPQIQKAAVHTYGWLTVKQFADAFAIAQAAPGPSTLLVSAVGYETAGLWGAVLATAAMIVPAGLLMFGVARFWLSIGQSRWRQAIEDGLASITIGLILSSAIVIAWSVEHSFVQFALTAITAVVLCATRLNPLWVMGACGFLGWVGGA